MREYIVVAAKDIGEPIGYDDTVGGSCARCSCKVRIPNSSLRSIKESPDSRYTSPVCFECFIHEMPPLSNMQLNPPTREQLRESKGRISWINVMGLDDIYRKLIGKA